MTTHILTDSQSANLDKLATYLEALPVDWKHFDMNVFFEGGYNEENPDAPGETEYVEDPSLINHCGTVACALGHGPAAGIAPSQNAKGNFGIDWSEYTEQFVPDGSVYDRFLFSGVWRNIDNTHRGAAARMRYLLDRGAVPETFGYCAEVPDEYAEYLVA